MKFQRFVPITKKDAKKKMVYGWASTPNLDADGEIITVDAIKKALPDYLKFPTIREMHQAKAVGVTKETKIDKKKGLYIGAKIVDADAWEKVEEGVYRGFSIGGKVKNQVDNLITDISLTEISVVDSPANKQSVITLFKNDSPDLMLKQMLPQIDEFTQSSINLADAQSILRSAAELSFIRSMRSDEGKNTKDIDKAIKMLKQVAVKVLNEDDKKKFDLLIEMTKSKLKLLKMPDWQLKQLSMWKRNQKNSFKNYELQKAKKELSMLTKAKKTKKPEKEVKEEVVETPTEEVVEEPAEPKEPATEPKEPEVVVDEAKQTADKSDLTKRLEKIEKSLEKEEEVKKVKKLDVNKVDSLEKNIGLMASSIEKLVDRVVALEAQPKPTKTKVALVDKTFKANSEEEEVSPELAKVNKRIKELVKMREDEPGKFVSEFAEEAQSLLAKRRAMLIKK